jgi:hypothetical protein
MNPYGQATNNLGTADGLARIRMSPGKRRMARASMRQAELIVDLLMRANDDLRRVFGFVRRGINALARRSKVPAVAPEWRLP